MFTKFGMFKLFLDEAAAGAGGSGAAAGGTGSGGSAAGAAAGANGAGATPATFDELVASLPEAQQKLVAERFTALDNTVKATRKERDDLSKELRSMAAKAEKGSQAEADLLKRAGELDEANRRADFYADAPANDCKNSKAAYAIAVAGEHFNPKTGLVDWKALKEAAPELFGKPSGKANAGNGTNREQRGTMTMNEYIRAKAGAASDQD